MKKKMRTSRSNRNSNFRNTEPTKLKKKITPIQQQEKAYFHRHIITTLSNEHFLGGLQLRIVLLYVRTHT